MTIIPARPEHVASILAIFADTTAELRSRGIDQWDEVYPNRERIEQDLAEGTLWVALIDDRVVGTVCLSEEQEEAYALVPWTFGEPVLVVHRLCVPPEHQGKGIASRLMDFAEELAAARGYASIRLDAYGGNPPAVRFYEKRGYHTAGYVNFPRRSLLFPCMELAIPRGERAADRSLPARSSRDHGHHASIGIDPS